MSKEISEGGEVVAALHQMVELLREMAAWSRVANRDSVRALLESALDTPQKRYVYQSTDGSTTRKEIVARSQGTVGEGTVSGWWAQWDSLGITSCRPSPNGAAKRERCFDLSDFGIGIPAAGSLKSPAE